MSYLVKHYMKKEFSTVVGEVTLVDAAKLMQKSGVGFLIVLERGNPVGIATEHDFVYRAIAADLDPKKATIAEIMSSPIITVDPDEDLLVASEAMQRHNIRKLPVVKEGIIYGVLSARDISEHYMDYVNKSVKDIMRWAAPLGG